MRVSRALGILAALAAVGGAGVLVATNPGARSAAIRALSHRRRDVAKERHVAITTSVDRGEWVRLPLQADLSAALTAVAGRPLAAAVHSHFGGFGGRPFSAWLDPESPYYQAWLGAYAVFADGNPPFGFDVHGKPQPEAAVQLLEADQRLVLDSVGLVPVDDPRPRVRTLGELAVEHVVAWGGDWVKVSGAGETTSGFQLEGQMASWRSRWLYGVVPAGYCRCVQEFHPVTYHASLWYRYDAALEATVAKFYSLVEYVNVGGQVWRRGLELEDECLALLDRMRFDRESCAVSEGIAPL